MDISFATMPQLKLQTITMIHWNKLSELNGAEVYAIFMLRQQVFMLEQNCLYPDIDKEDKAALHLRYLDNQQHLAGYLRVIYESNDSSLSIGRVAVRKKVRKRGVAKEMMEAAIKKCQEEFPNQKIRLAGQSYLIDFYSSFGFVPIGPEYVEDDIPHQDMVLQT